MRKDRLYVTSIIVLILILNMNWIGALIRGDILDIEEGYADIAGISSISESKNPFYYDLLVYGQPGEGMPYGKLSFLFIPILLNVIIQNSMASYVGAIILILSITSLILFFLLSGEFKLKKEISLFFSLLYILSNPLLVQMFTQGQLKFLMNISLPVILLYIWIKLNDISITQNKKIAYLIGFSLISLLLIFTNIIIYVTGLALLLFISPHIIKIDKAQYFKTILKMLVSILPWCIVWFVTYRYYYLPYFNFEGFSSSSYEYFNMPQPLLTLFGNIGQSNRIPIGLQASTDIFSNFILSLPFFLFLTYFVNRKIKKEYILLFCILSIMFLSMGIYGPYSFIFSEYVLPFRAPGRTFLPLIYPFLIVFGAIGTENIIRNIEFRPSTDKILKIFFIVSLFILYIQAYSIGSNYQFSNTVDPKIDSAFSSLEPYNRIMMIPVGGNLGSKISISNNGTYNYQQNPAVGYSLVHMNEYLAARYHLKDAFSPPSQWESPFLATWTISDFLWEKITKWKDYNGFYAHLKLFPNLKYLVLYKKISSREMINELSKNSGVTKTYENDKILALEIKDQTSGEIITSNKAFLLYTSSWQYGHSTILTLMNKFNVSYPVIFEAATPWYMLRPDQFDKSMIIVFNNIYSKADLSLDYFLFNEKSGGEIISNFKPSNQVEFWQPAYNKKYMYILDNINVRGEIDVEKEGYYRILVRTAYNGVWRGNYAVNLDGKNIIYYNYRKDQFGWGWIKSDKLSLKKGSHTIKINGAKKYGEINSIILIPEDKYKEIMLENYELYKGIDQNPCISGYEFEHINGFKKIYEKNAVSGGHPEPYLIKNKVETTIFSPCSNIKYAVLLGNATKLKINGISQSPENLGNGLILYRLSEAIDENELSLYVKGSSLDAVWFTNFDPSELYNIKNEVIETPESYWGEYNFRPSPGQKFMLLMKSYSPLFNARYNGKDHDPYVSNMMLNGFYLGNGEKSDSVENISIELNYLRAMKLK